MFKRKLGTFVTNVIAIGVAFLIAYTFRFGWEAEDTFRNINDALVFSYLIFCYIAVFAFYRSSNGTGRRGALRLLKEAFLKVFTPNLIHKQFIGEEKKRVFSYEKNYEKLLKEKTNDIFWKNSYYDYDKDMGIEFFDYHLGTKKYLYFLYYEIGEYSFHSPVSEKIAESNTELEIQEIDENFKTHGSKIEGLLSMQFVKKVL